LKENEQVREKEENRLEKSNLGTGRVAQVIEQLPSKCEALSSNTLVQKEEEKEEEENDKTKKKGNFRDWLYLSGFPPK
jgi:hypothetical protein